MSKGWPFWWKAFILSVLPVYGCGQGPSEGVEGDRGSLTGILPDEDFEEISGVSVSRILPDLLWVANDGGKERIFAVTSSGQVVARVDYSGKVKDVEDMAAGHGPEGNPVIFLGDFGDNDRDRDDIRILALAEPSLEITERGRRIDLDPLKVTRIEYPGGESIDCECLLFDQPTGDFYLITKEKGRGRLYRVRGSQFWENDRILAEFCGILDGVESVSGGDLSSDGQRLILRNESSGWMWVFSREGRGRLAVSGDPEMVPVLGSFQGPNGESLAISPWSACYYTVSEGKGEALYKFNLAPHQAGEGD